MLISDGVIQAFGMLQLIRERSLQPNLQLFTVLASACSPKTAPLVLSEMQSYGITPKHKFFEALISSFSRRGHLGKVFDILNIMESSFGLTPDITTYYTVLLACSSAHDINAAKYLRDMMRERNVVPNSVFLAQMISLCGKHDKQQSGRGYDERFSESQAKRSLLIDCFTDMRTYNIEPNTEILNALMSNVEEPSHEILNLMQELVQFSLFGQPLPSSA